MNGMGKSTGQPNNVQLYERVCLGWSHLSCATIEGFSQGQKRKLSERRSVSVSESPRESCEEEKGEFVRNNHGRAPSIQAIHET